VAAGLGRYGAAQDGTPGAGTPAASPVASPAASPIATPEAAAEGITVAVAMREFAFEPREISIPADTDVTIALSNIGGAVHNFWLSDVDQGTEFLNPGAEAQLPLNLPAGEYRVLCTVPGHSDLGMVAKLVAA
jgi:uncharacterized cupredoxin-like copper-binding protein